MAGGDRESRADAVRHYLEAGGLRLAHVVEDTVRWPFQRNVTPIVEPPSGPAALWIRDLHLAFPAGQAQGTRLVLTQSTYQLQRWLDRLEPYADTILVADGDLPALRASSPEAFAERGPWSRIEIVELEPGDAAGSSRRHDGEASRRQEEAAPPGELHAVFTQPDAGMRLDVCRRALAEDDRNAALHLAVGSALMELGRLEEAAAVLDDAAAVAPDWEAVHFEAGKLWLRADDTERAAAAFAEAARLMPHFAAALLNLGGALGEMDRRGEALAVLRRALDTDPHSPVVLNNIGAVHREDGRLDEAAEAFRQVIALSPGFVFGYYNLGHTLFLAGEFAGARTAYEEGFSRDAQKNARQACRLAMACAAAGDAAGAVQLIEELGNGLPAERRRDLFEEAESTLVALSAVPTVEAGAVSETLAAVRRYSS